MNTSAMHAFSCTPALPACARIAATTAPSAPPSAAAC
eukprot:CAMPEP_0179989904 /NCGR_PEP_ID=MMETSP0984-20121128/4145_1 /TAXON_ID=483367 /ORGANISM="non described non described, Strain CCMP 2436" /LENGTH=36 /DNA_ID= /DNA_START= /DNA_END= /DNA_ORIENTATION=